MSIIQEITDGQHDTILDAVSQALRARRKYLSDKQGLENMAELTPGTRVVVCGNISPKYMLGTPGVVMDEPARRRGSIMVRLDFPQGRYGQEVGIPANCLKPEGASRA